jgi:hypothetical protein
MSLTYPRLILKELFKRAGFLAGQAEPILQHPTGAEYGGIKSFVEWVPAFTRTSAAALTVPVADRPNRSALYRQS